MPDVFYFYNLKKRITSHESTNYELRHYMKPINQKAYNTSLIKFFLMWLVTTALIVFACLEIFKSPKLENDRLKREVEELRADSIQQYLMTTTVDGINGTLESLSKSYNEDTLRKLSNYPKEDIADGKMKDKISEMSGRIAEVVRLNSASKGDAQKELDHCNKLLELERGKVSSLEIDIQILRNENNRLKYQQPSTGGI